VRRGERKGHCSAEYVYMHIYAIVMPINQVMFFKALGDETRLNIVKYLLKNEHCACDFKPLKHKDQTTISRHLKVLTEAGIVKHRKSGRNVIFSIRDEKVRSRLLAIGIEGKDGRCCDTTDSRETFVKESVKKAYGKIATSAGSCGCGEASCCGPSDPITISSSLGYSDRELKVLPESNLGLGCGNPNAIGAIRRGDTVLDLGSGAGMDAFIAARKVGKKGKVIGVDITKEMVSKARRNAKDNGFTNVEFRLGDIEDLPVESNSVDVILSNCVINLAPDKSRVFNEAHRVLKPSGKMYLSDMVLTAELSEAHRNDQALIAGCVGGAILRDDYLNRMREAGFQIEEMAVNKGPAKNHHQGFPVESLKIMAKKVDRPLARRTTRRRGTLGGLSSSSQDITI
jgi:arsenite methyltransferase